jgi:hypothetical protein
MLDIINNLFQSNNEINVSIQRHRVLKQEFEAISKSLETDWAYKKVEILERADIVTKGSKSYSISVDTYEDDDYWQLISDLKSCKKFIYMVYDMPQKISITDYERLNIENKEWAKQYFIVGPSVGLTNLIKPNKYINKIYFSFYF